MRSPTQRLCGAAACARGFRRVQRTGILEEGVHSAWADLIEGDGLSAEGRRQYAELVATYPPERVHPGHEDRTAIAKAFDIRLKMLNPMLVCPVGKTWGNSPPSAAA